MTDAREVTAEQERAAIVAKFVRDLTESGDFYSGTPQAWAQYRAAVEVGDWDEVMRFETGCVEGFHYDP